MPVLRKAFRQSAFGFLSLPVTIVCVFIILAEVVDWLDNHAGSRSAWGPLRLWLSQYVGDTQAAIGVLSAIAGSLFTVTSVTFSILLLAVQQGATVLNSQIVDHYLRRRANRAWFGFFVGVSVFVLITLVQTTHTAAPVFGVIVSTLLGAIALTALILLIYATVNQTRPATVIQAIFVAASKARTQQEKFLRRTGPPPPPLEKGILLRSTTEGYLIDIDNRSLANILRLQPQAKLTILQSFGSFVAKGEALAQLLDYTPSLIIQERIVGAFLLSEQRDLEQDPALNLDHIATIGWTAISTAHSDPAVGGVAIQTLQRLMLEWKNGPERCTDDSTQIFYSDVLFEKLLDAVESLIVAATESRQHQSLALLLTTIRVALPSLSAEHQQAVFAMYQTIGAGLVEHLPTHRLRVALTELINTFQELGGEHQAEDLRIKLRHLLEHSIG